MKLEVVKASEAVNLALANPDQALIIAQKFPHKAFEIVCVTKSHIAEISQIVSQNDRLEMLKIFPDKAQEIVRSNLDFLLDLLKHDPDLINHALDIVEGELAFKAALLCPKQRNILLEKAQKSGFTRCKIESATEAEA